MGVTPLSRQCLCPETIPKPSGLRSPLSLPGCFWSRQVCPGGCSRPSARCVYRPELGATCRRLCGSGPTLPLCQGDCESSGVLGPCVCVPAGLPVSRSHRPHLWIVPAWSRASSRVLLPGLTSKATIGWFLLSLCPYLRLCPSSSLICLWSRPVSPGLRPRRAGIHHWSWGEFHGTGTLSARSAPSPFNLSPSPSSNFLFPEAL